MSNIYKQLCWSCCHACSSCDCVWVETLNKELAIKAGVYFDKNNYITFCKNYKKEKDYYTSNKLKAFALGVSETTYMRLKREITEFNLSMTPEELYNLKQELKAEKKNELEHKKEARQQTKLENQFKELQEEIDRQSARELGITYKKYLLIKQEAKTVGKTAEEFYFDKINEENRNKQTDKSKAEALGLSTSYYCKLKKQLLKKGLTPEQYYQEKELQKQRKFELLQKAKHQKETDRDKAIKMGITSAYYAVLKREIRNKGLKISPEELRQQKKENANKIRKQFMINYHKQKGQGLSQREKAEALGVNLYKYKDLLKEIRKKCLSMTPEELYNLKQQKHIQAARS